MSPRRRAGPLSIQPELRLELALLRAIEGADTEAAVDLVDVLLVESTIEAPVHDDLWALDAALEHDPLELLALTGIARRELGLPHHLLGFDWDVPNEGLYCIEVGWAKEGPCSVDYWYRGSLWPHRWPTMAAFVRWRYGTGWCAASFTAADITALERQIDTFQPYIRGAVTSPGRLELQSSGPSEPWLGEASCAPLIRRGS